MMSNICGNGILHAKSEWCGLQLTPSEQQILAGYLAAIIAVSDDPLVEATTDLLYALKYWSKD